MKKYRTLAAVVVSAALIALPLILVQPGQSIQAAVNAAVAGDVITVSPGAYSETVRITKSNITIQCAVSLGCTVMKFEVWGSGNTIDGFIVSGGSIAGYDVRAQNNTVRNTKITNIKINSGDANGIILFGTGHVFENVHIYGIDQYAFGDPHQDCFQTWDVPARGGAADYISISNVLCDMPQAGTSISKAIQSSGGSHDWTIRNLLSLAPMACLFYDEAYNIDIAYSTFIGMGISQPQGCKFLDLLTGASPPHDNKITNSIFQNITSGPVIYETGNAVISSNNCYWQTSPRNPDPGDVYTNPLLLPDYSVPANSPCFGKGALPWSFEAGKTLTPTLTPTPTRTATLTPTKTATPTATITPIPTVCETMVSTKYHVTVCTK